MNNGLFLLTAGSATAIRGLNGVMVTLHIDSGEIIIVGINRGKLAWGGGTCPGGNCPDTLNFYP